jgi:hypothetical protein
MPLACGRRPYTYALTLPGTWEAATGCVISRVPTQFLPLCENACRGATQLETSRLHWLS